VRVDVGARLGNQNGARQATVRVRPRAKRAVVPCGSDPGRSAIGVAAADGPSLGFSSEDDDQTRELTHQAAVISFCVRLDVRCGPH
jgi:hypothetical protein